MVTPYVGYLLSYATTSLVVFSAYESLQSVDVNRWRLVQSRYHGQFKYAIQRIRDTDTMMQNQMIQNVETTVGRIFQSPQYNQVQTYNDSIQLIYKMINNSYTDYHWIMTMKQLYPQPATTSDSFYYNCFNCFVTSDLGKIY